MFYDQEIQPTNAYHPGRETLDTGEHTLTVQSAREDADINIIVKRMTRTGLVPNSARVPTQGDFSEQVTDYHTAMNMVRTANTEFMKLPAKIRSRFQNDPQELITYLSDPLNLEESYKLGLRVKPPVTEPEPPIKVEVVPPPTPST